MVIFKYMYHDARFRESKILRIQMYLYYNSRWLQILPFIMIRILKTLW
jgi:hypothetical protein